MIPKKLIYTYGDIAVAEMLKEYKKLHELGVFGTLNPYTLTNKEKIKARKVVNLIKENICINIKGCSCSSNRPQRR